MTNDYPVINPKEYLRLWPIYGVFYGIAIFVLCSDLNTDGYFPAEAVTWLKAAIWVAMAGGVWVYLRRGDSPLQRLKRKRSIVAQTWQGAYVVGKAEHPRTLERLTAQGLSEAENAYFAATGKRPKADLWDGYFITFKPGLPGGPNSPAGHYVYSGAYFTPNAGQIQYDSHDSEQTVLNRVYFGALMRIDSKLRAPGMYQEHVAYLNSVGVDLRGVPL